MSIGVQVRFMSRRKETEGKGEFLHGQENIPDTQTLPDDEQDARLAEAAAHGDKGAFERLAWRWWDRIRGYCSAFVSFDPDLAEEAAQESLIRLYKALPGWKRKSPLGGYIYGICRTASNDVLRKAARHGVRTSQIEDFQLAAIESHHAAGEDALYREHAKQAVTRAMSELPPDDRAMIYLHLVEDKPLSEIAALYKVPVGTVKSRLFRLKEKLGQRLKEMGYEYR
ncbi:MAG: sigma-70 family RNA polymerase sigma factor [Rectinemataceae bacterium]|nr:sigma-70 family RNA polymerase sigma factor [Spirochaetaceae bacterium]